MKKFDISNLIITRIHDIYTCKLGRDVEASHTLSHSVLLIRRTGESTYRVNGKEYTADANHILFLPATTAYEMEVEKVGLCTVIEIDAANEASTMSPLSFYADNESDLMGMLKNLCHYWTLKGPACESKCMSVLYSMITQISTLDSYSQTLAGKYGLIHKSVKYIESHYTDPELYTPQLAEMSGIGETYYRNIFIAVFSTPPTRYIQQYRIDKAKELLMAPNASVDDIAVRVGFANASYFCKVFKSSTGMTPTEFAAQRRLLG